MFCLCPLLGVVLFLVLIKVFKPFRVYFCILCEGVFFFYWGTVALWCCVSFCCTTKWVTHLYPLSLGSPHPIAPMHVAAEHWDEPPVIFIRFLLAIYLTQGSVYMSTPISQFSPPSFPQLMSTHPFSMSASYFYAANRFICSIFLDSTYVHWYIQSLFLTYFIHMTDSRSIHVSTNDETLFLFIQEFHY